MRSFLELLNLVPFSPAALVLGYLLDLAIGDPERFSHPVRWIGRLISGFENLLLRPDHGARRKKAAGAVLALSTVFVVYSVSLLVLYISYEVSPYLCFALSAFFVWTGLSTRSLAQEARGVLKALETGGLEAARGRLSRIVGRDTQSLSEGEVLRATVETVSENTSDGVVAPLFYLAAGGPALMMAYKAVNTLDSMVGYRNERYRDFGWFSARLDDAANYVPARLSGALAVTAAFILGYNWKSSVKVLLRDGRKHPSPNSGVPEAAFAGALGVRLGGTSTYGGVASAKPHIGDEARPFTPQAVEMSIRLMWATAFLMLMAALLARTAVIFIL